MEDVRWENSITDGCKQASSSQQTQDRFKAAQTEMKEIPHKCLGPKEPYTHTRGKYPIDGAYKTPEVEIVNLSMVTFAQSPGDHRSLLFDISTRSLLGEHKYKVCRPVSWRLITSQPSFIKRYNKIVCEQFGIHHKLKEWTLSTRWQDIVATHCLGSYNQW